MYLWACSRLLQAWLRSLSTSYWSEPSPIGTSWYPTSFVPRCEKSFQKNIGWVSVGLYRLYTGLCGFLQVFARIWRCFGKYNLYGLNELLQNLASLNVPKCCTSRTSTRVFTLRSLRKWLVRFCYLRCSSLHGQFEDLSSILQCELHVLVMLISLHHYKIFIFVCWTLVSFSSRIGHSSLSILLLRHRSCWFLSSCI